MIKGTGKTFFFTMLFIFVSVGLMLSALFFFGAQNRNITVQDLPEKLIYSVELPGILEEDYESYPIDKIENDGTRASYMLTGQDAAVLAAKQIEDISGESAKGYYWLMSYEPTDECWIAACTDVERGEFVFGAQIDATTGMIQQYSNFDSTEYWDYGQEDLDICINSALNLAEKYFNYDREGFDIEKAFNSEMYAEPRTNSIEIMDGYVYINIVLNEYYAGYNQILELRYNIGNHKLLSFYGRQAY